MQWLLSGITVTSAYVNIISVITNTRHHLAAVGAVLLHSLCMNFSERFVIRTCNIVCACYGDTIVIPFQYLYFLSSLYTVEMCAVSKSAGTFPPVNTVFE